MFFMLSPYAKANVSCSRPVANGLADGFTSENSANRGTFRVCVCHLHWLPADIDVEANTPLIPRSSFLDCISSTTALNVSKFLISSIELTFAPGRAKYLFMIALL